MARQTIAGLTSQIETLDELLTSVRFDITMTKEGEATIEHVPASLADIARIAQGSGWTTTVHGVTGIVNPTTPRP